MPRRAGLPAPWAIGVLLTALLIACLPTSAAIFPQWLNMRGFFSHGFLVVAMIGALVWRDRAALGASIGAPNAWFLPLTLAASAAWFVAWAASVLLVQIVALLAMAWLATGAMLGWRALLRVTPYFALFLTAIPLWGPLQPPLQALATDIVNVWLRMFDMTVFVEGITIHTPHIVFEVQGGCSGLGFLLTAACLSGYLALQHRLPAGQAALLIVGSLVLALVVNWVRIFLIVTAGYHYGVGHFIVKDHVWFGWVVFGVIFLPLLFVIVPRLPLPGSPAGSPATPPTAPSGRAIRAGTLASAVLAAIALPVYGGLIEWIAAPTRGTAGAELPAASQGYVETTPSRSWQPVFETADDQWRTAFRPSLSDARGYRDSIEVFAATYWRQRDGAEVINVYTNDLVGAGWRVSEPGNPVGEIAGIDHPVSELRLRGEDDRQLLIWTWYRIGSARTSTPMNAKLLQIRERLLGRADGAVVAIAAFCNTPGCDDARENLTRFLAQSVSPAS